MTRAIEGYARTSLDSVLVSSLWIQIIAHDRDTVQ